MFKEKAINPTPGIPALLLVTAVFSASLGGTIYFGNMADKLSDLHESVTFPTILIIACSLVLLISIICLCGFYFLSPNQAAVLQLFGNYKGTVRTDGGLCWANPFIIAKKISLRVNTFESSKLKVNDLDGNPIEIGAVVTWRVIDTAQAVFNVETYTQFVTIQSEAALRNLATHFPYDVHDDEKIALRSHTDLVAEKLKTEVEKRLAEAGVEVIEARISHLAYAQEIAQAMLQRQQAGAIIAARQRIVEGAVGMVEMALERIEAQGRVKLDEERKAAMVSNLLVVLCSERSAQPVVNTGTLYH
ncbi:MAG: SPFH domain-containing protein [Holophagales bacterium]|jgi:regulator of protease activity HflC (stomatin/prohibitin superfamily)|nr:SPFH domain-containing protein [Holophagales bacterium]